MARLLGRHIALPSKRMLALPAPALFLIAALLKVRLDKWSRTGKYTCFSPKSAFLLDNRR